MKLDYSKFAPVSDLETDLLKVHPKAKFIVGIDECGWGAIAGPITVGGCLMSVNSPQPLFGDSKKLSNKKMRMIIDHGMSFPPQEVTSLTYVAFAYAEYLSSEGGGAFQATPVEAWDKCFALLMDKLTSTLQPDAYFPVFRVKDAVSEDILVVIDGTRVSPRVQKTLEVAKIPYVLLPKADAQIRAVSQAAIHAKVSRDEYMTALHKMYPEYSFDKNKGYPTPEHLQALKEHKACFEHRRNIQVVRDNQKAE